MIKNGKLIVLTFIGLCALAFVVISIGMSQTKEEDKGYHFDRMIEDSDIVEIN